MRALKLLLITSSLLICSISYGQKWNYKNLSIGLNTPINSHMMYINISKSNKNNLDLRSLYHTTDGYTFWKITIENSSIDYFYELTREPFTKTQIHLKPGKYKIILYGKTWTVIGGIVSDGSGSIRIGWFGK